MNINTITAEDLRRMPDKEGLILQGCGGDLTEWVDGINEMLTNAGILKDGSQFENVFAFQHGELTCLLYPFDDVKLDIGKLALWRLQTHEVYGGTWLSDFVPNYLGGFIETPEPLADKPDCPLIGADGNIFNLLGIASRTLREHGLKEQAKEKASRIINRLCMKFHLDQIEEEAEAGEPDNRYMRTVKPYNALFARLADALNPAHIEKTAVLSIHPCDFLEMSNRDNTWSSCHCLEGGGYRGGCQSYMGDAVSMIFFTVSDEYTQDFQTAPRITREIFCYKDNVLLQSRLYPTDLEDQKTLYRSIVQQAIATCLDKPNLWSIKRGKETEPYCESAVDSNHYPDYEYGYAVVSLLKGESDYGKMTIGSVARCVCCGGEQKNHRSIRCAECGNMYVCKGCGKTVHGYGRYIDNHFYCNECSYECTVCKERFIGMPRIGIARSGERRGICTACYEQVIGVCGNCTIHGDCLSIGANRFCPNQMNGLAA